MFLQQLINGLTVGATYALVAVGFALVYGVLRLVNFSHGAFYLLGAYLILTFNTFTGSFLLSMVLSIVLTGALGALMDKGILQPIRKKNDEGIPALIATLGFGTFLINLIIALYGSETKPFPNVLSFGSFRIGNAIVMWHWVIIAGIALVTLAILSVIVYRTKFGTAMRAISQSPNAARLMGIPVNRTIAGTFFIGTMCAALSGTLVAMYYRSIDTTMYLAVSMKTFTAAVLGGIGSLPGALVGGLLIGVLETFVAGYIDSAYRNAAAFALLIIILLIRPDGLFGHKSVDKV